MQENNNKDLFYDDFKESKKEDKSHSSIQKIADKLLENIDAHPFLNLKKEDDELLYKTERYKFLTLCLNYTLFRYSKYIKCNLPSIDPETFCFETNTLFCDHEYSEVILSATIEAVKKYKPEEGKFSYYFNSCISIVLNRNRSNNSIDEKFYGMLSRQDKRAAKEIFALSSKYCKENHVSQDEISQKSEEIISMIYQNSVLGKERIESIMKLLYETKFEFGDVSQSDDNSTSTMSNQADPTQNTEQMLEQYMLQIEYGKIIDKVVQSTQARTVPTIRAYITNVIYDAHYEKSPELITKFSKFEFFDKEFAKEIEIKLEERGSVFTNKEIADRFNVSNANITNITKTFKKRMLEEMKKADL